MIIIIIYNNYHHHHHHHPMDAHGLINFGVIKSCSELPPSCEIDLAKLCGWSTQGNVNPFGKIAHGTPKKFPTWVTQHMTHLRQQESSTAMFLYQAVPGSRRGGTFEKTKKTLYRKKMLYRKVLEMQKQRSVEVVKPINEWANGGWDATDMTWKNPCTTEWMNQWAK